MILLDSLYINNGGGKILLDYLILEAEKSELEIHYLIDARIRHDHPTIKTNKVTYIVASLINRHTFYRKYGKHFSKVLCFGNLPPTLRLRAKVYTYFHQKLFLEVPIETPFKQKIIFNIKSKVFKFLKRNTDFWIVQSRTMESQLAKHLRNGKDKVVFVIPFYPPVVPRAVDRKSDRFLYVSSGMEHKNHHNLIEGFKKFYLHSAKGELHLTIGNEYPELLDFIEKAKIAGLPIVNHGFVPRENLSEIYGSAKFSIYPSKVESFGLGIVEAIENGCDIVGANLPYMFEVCEPSVIFNPEVIDDICKAFHSALKNIDQKKTIQKIFNQVDDLISLLKE